MEIYNEDMPENYTFFYSGIFSQWHIALMTIGKVEYNCCEQFMHSQKAIYFQDFKILHKIMKEEDPKIQKKLGREVKGFKKNKWERIAKSVIFDGNFAKFTQHLDLQKALLETKGTILAEASAKDRLYGIGLSASDPLALHHKTWKGKNWLGETLTIVREEIIKIRKVNHV